MQDVIGVRDHERTVEELTFRCPAEAVTAPGRRIEVRTWRTVLGRSVVPAVADVGRLVECSSCGARFPDRVLGLERHVAGRGTATTRRRRR